MLYQGVPLESEAAPNTDAIGNKVCFTVLKGAGIPTHEEICPELRRRLLVTCTVKGAAPCTFFRDRSLVRQRSSCSRKRNRYWCPWDATTIVERCEVEETEEAQESSDTLLLLEPLSMLLRGKMLPSRATLSRQVRLNAE